MFVRRTPSRMGDRHGECVRGIRALRAASGQEDSNHHRDLRFLGVAGPGQGFLDEIGRIFRNGEARQRWDDERNCACLTEL